MNNNNATPTVVLNQMCGAVMGILGMYKIPFEVIADATWREQIYGFGRRKGWSSPDWKRHAKENCRQMGIQISNADEAEAALLAFYGGRKSKYVEMIRRSESNVA